MRRVELADRSRHAWTEAHTQTANQPQPQSAARRAAAPFATRRPGEQDRIDRPREEGEWKEKGRSWQQMIGRSAVCCSCGAARDQMSSALLRLHSNAAQSFFSCLACRELNQLPSSSSHLSAIPSAPLFVHRLIEMSAPLTAAGPSAAAAEAKQPEKAQSVRGQFFAPEKGSAESVTAGVGAKPAHAPCGLAEKVRE